MMSRSYSWTPSLQWVRYISVHSSWRTLNDDIAVTNSSHYTADTSRRE